MNKEINNKRESEAVGGGGEVQKVSEYKMSVSKRERGSSVAWKFDEITNGFQGKGFILFSQPLFVILEKRNVYIRMWDEN